MNVRRVSHEPRNPKNAPNKREKSQLESFAEIVAAKKTPVLAAHHDNQSVTFYAAITINNPLCLKCHGDPSTEINKDVLKLINKKYPEDKATGFASNDLRGMWVIEFTKSEKP